MSLIKSLPVETSHLLTRTLLLTNYEVVVRQTIERFIRAGCRDLTLTLFPAALRFTLAATKAPSVPPSDLLQTLSAQCSIEYRSKDETVHMRGAELLDKPAERSIGHGCELEVWEMFFTVPVRRRLQQGRDHLGVINSTRNYIIPVVFANPDTRIVVEADGETKVLSWEGNGLSVDGIQAMLGTYGLSFSSVRLQLGDNLITGFLSRSGFSNARVQYAALDGNPGAEWLSDIVKSAWKRFLNCKASQSRRSLNQSQDKTGRHAAFVIRCDTSDRGKRKCLKQDEAIWIRREVHNELLMALFHILMGTRKRKAKWSNLNTPVETKGAFVLKRPRFEDAKVRRRVFRPSIPVHRVRLVNKCSTQSFPDCALHKHVAEWCNPTCDNNASLGLQGGVWERKAMSIDKESLRKVHVVGQVDCKFLVVSDEKGLYAVDQHAASERDLFERLLRKAQRGIKTVECLESINLSKERRQIASRHSDLLHRWGWHLTITEEKILMTGIPSVCDVLMTKRHLLELLDEVCENDQGVLAGTIPEFVWRTVATVACHKAVRFGDRLSYEQSENVIRAMAMCDNPFSCAHGRPSIVPLAMFGSQE